MESIGLVLNPIGMIFVYQFFNPSPFNFISFVVKNVMGYDIVRLN